MKKIFLALIGVSFLALSVTSCEKTCTCTTSIGGVAVGDPQEKTMKKGKCDELNETIELKGVPADVVCVE